MAACYQQPDGRKLVDIMTDRIAHRGPDATGTWNHEDERVAVQFGHRRLSIIDLSAAADQPLSKHGMTLVYNGELYNYRALRAELAARGVRFATSSDTEVVLEAWRNWGPAALRRFRGMFAFALADEQAGDLVPDVPVSSFLSGGLDSSIVTVLAHQAEAGIDAYTITFRPEDQRLEAMPDDAVYARKVAARYGIDLHEIEISPDIVDMLPRIVDVLDEPIGDPAAINTLLMCEAARERGVKVMLSG